MRLAHQLPGLVARQARKSGVGPEDFTFLVGNDNAIGGGFECRNLQVELPLSLLALGDIDNDAIQGRALFALQRGLLDVEKHPNRLAIFAPEAGLVIAQAALFVKIGNHPRPGTRIIPELAGINANQFRGRVVAHHAGHRFVAVQDSTLRRTAQQPGHIAVEKEPVAILGNP